ncbi:hypothetical protein KVH22_25265 [Streptomyces olivaceus]|uniref:hypothetical protein n=1 Tax=Streptomyces olivaceus TaxID=47716 RepID=UPI001CC9748F|nr:hypothetical protein [Streptomyces olivaceus]MBZ6258828.1 hypothetical protein [Streptomyces olivaceus]
MTTGLAPAPAATGQGHDDLVHVACVCDPDTALCGTDVTGQNWQADDDEDATCVVCVDLEYKPCKRCGW